MFVLNFNSLFLTPMIVKSCRRVRQFAGSALYITGDKAHETFSVLTPYLDFDERLKKKSLLERNIKLRGLSINVDDIENIWKFYKTFKYKKIMLEQSKGVIAQTIKNLSKNPNPDEEEIEKLKVHGRLLKEDLKVLRENFWSVEEKAVVKVLALPNVIHEKTPLHELTTIFIHKSKPQNKSKCNIDIGINLKVLDYQNPQNYYLMNEAAMFELCCPHLIADKLIESDFIQTSNSDFSRSVVVEGCGLPFFDSDKVFTVEEHDVEHKHENSRLHLTGGASLSSFMAYHTKHVVFPSLLPLKYFTIGRKYNPVTQNECSLLNVTQETALDIFVATLNNDDDMNQEFNEILNSAIGIYETLNFHFRVVHLPVRNLQTWESLRASIQMFSCYKNDYVEVGHISICDDYISKRLLFNYADGSNVQYPKIICGTVVSVPKMLACILENEEELLQPVWKQYVT